MITNTTARAPMPNRANRVHGRSHAGPELARTEAVGEGTQQRHVHLLHAEDQDAHADARDDDHAGGVAHQDGAQLFADASSDRLVSCNPTRTCSAYQTSKK